MQNRVKVLVIGDIIGKGARNAFIAYLPTLKEKYQYDIISINAENTTHGKGLNYNHYKSYNNAKIDVMTMGNHVIDNTEIFDYIDKTNNLVVPGNIDFEQTQLNNHKECIVEFNGFKIKFLNLVGTFSNKKELKVSDPLSYFDEIYQDDGTIYIIDYHAEYTLEKNLIGYYTDGRASFVYGTHTHVQTADERILPKGCAYITDVGMCGSIDSVIGYDYESFLAKRAGKGNTFVSVRQPLMLNGALVEIDLETKKAISILRIREEI